MTRTRTAALTMPRTPRVGLTGCVAILFSVMFASSAHAHVTVSPGEAEGGGFAVVSFRVPNERDDARTTRVQVVLPEDQPVGSVRTTPVPGWRIVTDNRTLDEPIEMFGEEVTEVVSEVTWIANGDGIAPGQFVDFDVSLGPLPESGQMVFRAVQTYTSGEEVAWNQVAVDPAVEPERPAPILTITAPADGQTAEEAVDPTGQPETTSESAGADQSDDGSLPALPTVLSACALLVSVAALFVAWRRRPA